MRPAWAKVMSCIGVYSDENIIDDFYKKLLLKVSNSTGNPGQDSLLGRALRLSGFR